MTCSVDDLEVGDRRARARIPVDHVVVAVDQALLVERDEDPVDGLDVALVEGEALALVVAGGAEALVLLDDLAAVLLAPLPDALRRTPRGRGRGARCPRPAASSRPPPGWRSRRGRCRGSRARCARACGCIRVSASWTVPLSAWPMCSAPVTFGGGIAIEKLVSGVPSGGGSKAPLASQAAKIRASASPGSQRVVRLELGFALRVHRSRRCYAPAWLTPIR